MEKNITLKTSDGHIIYGIFNTAGKKNSTLAVFVHGLTGHPNEHIFYNAAHIFPQHGVDTFRFALYTGEKGGRKLRECTISTHADDLDRVVNFFRKKYQTISVVGHSLGGPTIMKSNFSQFGSIVLWDSSYLSPHAPDKPQKALINGKPVYIEEWGVEFLLNPKMYEEWLGFNGKAELPTVASLRKPLKIIVAGKGTLVKGGKKYMAVAQDPKSFSLIKNATHTFDEDGAEKDLLVQTLSWIKKHAQR